MSNNSFIFSFPLLVLVGGLVSVLPFFDIDFGILLFIDFFKGFIIGRDLDGRWHLRTFTVGKFFLAIKNWHVTIVYPDFIHHHVLILQYFFTITLILYPTLEKTIYHGHLKYALLTSDRSRKYPKKLNLKCIFVKELVQQTLLMLFVI